MPQSDGEYRRLSELFKSVFDKLDRLTALNTRTKEALAYRAWFINQAGPKAATVATRAALEHLYTQTLLSRHRATDSPSFPLPERLLNAYTTWADSLKVMKVSFENEPEMVIEFAGFLRTIQEAHQSLTEDRMVSLFQRWLNQLQPRSRFTYRQIAHDRDLARIQQSHRDSLQQMKQQYIQEGRLKLPSS